MNIDKIQKLYSHENSYPIISKYKEKTELFVEGVIPLIHDCVKQTVLSCPAEVIGESGYETMDNIKFLSEFETANTFTESKNLITNDYLSAEQCIKIVQEEMTKKKRAAVIAGGTAAGAVGAGAGLTALGGKTIRDKAQSGVDDALGKLDTAKKIYRKSLKDGDPASRVKKYGDINNANAAAYKAGEAKKAADNTGFMDKLSAGVDKAGQAIKGAGTHAYQAVQNNPGMAAASGLGAAAVAGGAIAAKKMLNKRKKNKLNN